MGRGDVGAKANLILISKRRFHKKVLKYCIERFLTSSFVFFQSRSAIFFFVIESTFTRFGSIRWFLIQNNISRNQQPDDEGEGDEQEDPAEELLLFVLGRANRNLTEAGVAEVEVGGEESEGKCADAEGHLEAAAAVADAPEPGLSRPRRFGFWKKRFCSTLTVVW